MWKKLKEHIVLKLISLGLAIILWYFVHYLGK